jgi:hypothetical protein
MIGESELVPLLPPDAHAHSINSVANIGTRITDLPRETASNDRSTSGSGAILIDKLGVRGRKSAAFQ